MRPFSCCCRRRRGREQKHQQAQNAPRIRGQRVVLVHHGEDERQSSGFPDPQLTTLGLEQARALRGNPLLEGCDLLVVSPLRRAVETAVAIFGEKPGCRAMLTALHTERWSGTCDEGQPKPELLKQFPFLTEWDGWAALPDGAWWPTASSDASFREMRVPAFHKWLRAQPERRIVVVGHGGFFEALSGGRQLQGGEACELPRTVLVDMDGVLCDFEAQFLRRWRDAHPEAAWLPEAQRRTHYVDKDPSGVYDTERSHAIITSPGFYETMPPMEGAIEALSQMEATGSIRTCICTAPFGTSEVAARCEAEKRVWVEANLGKEWLTPWKFVCVKDKTAVPGDLLIDDKPEPSTHWRHEAAESPSWKHVVFTQPFNVEDTACEGKPRLDRW
uniref:Uncharacterized protein n=1 Tax=Pyrodinium bahamense TaxID=73915 RepID=A0A7S0FI16_9DINO